MIKRANSKQKETILWNKQLYTLKALSDFPSPRVVAVSNADGPVYRNSGVCRKDERGIFVFQYTLKGCGALRVGDRVFDINREQGFLVEVADPDICYYYPEKCHGPWEFLFFVFKDSAGQAKTITAEYGYVYDLAIDTAMIKRLQMFRNTDKKVLEMSIGEGAMLVNSVLCTLVDVARAPMVNSKHIQLIREAHKLVEKNISLPYNSGMLADDLQVSQEHLNRVFSKETQTSPYRLIMRIKIREACLLLKESALSSKEIALKVGCEPGSHFARLFKRETGMTPIVFRRKGVMPF